MASTTLRDYLQYTEDAISTGRIDDALAQCQRILSHYPEALEAQRLLGEVYLAQEQLEEAQQAFDWILTNDPENIVVYCDRALICERMSDYDTALDCYQQAYELSRGNSQIRHEFNKLSTRVGQQGFMLSRAGLARLYMRGDLLSQAIQEWETILAANPERLDARTGLLETYWREGLFEQVEELANAILGDVPGCLKALLLLAHVTSLKDMQHAEELIQRAEMLDPELVMAQELFSDLIANQSQDPFLQLLQREAVTLPEQLPSQATPEAPTWSEPPTTNGSHGPSSQPSNELFSWSSLDTLITDSQQQEQLEQDIPTFTWSSNSALDINPWSTSDQIAGQPPVSEQEPAPVLEAEPEPASEQYIEPSSAQEAMTTAQPEWPQEDQFAEPIADAFNTWSGAGTMSQGEAAPDANAAESTWDTEAHEDPSLPTPPAWLDMLTKGGRPQSLSTPSGPLSGNKAETAASEPEPAPASPASRPSTPLFAEPTAPTRMPWEDDLETVSVGEGDDDEGFSFGPEWLKSLGAEVIETDTPVTPHPMETREPTASMGEEKPTASTPPSHNADFWQEAGIGTWSGRGTDETQQEEPIHSWLDQLNASPSNWQTPIDPWMEQSIQPAQSMLPAQSAQPAFEMQQAPVESWMEAVAEPTQPQQEPDIPTAEQQLATLEILERDLFAQGFVPLERGTLSKIAEEESLSSALAQFGSKTEQQLSTPVYEDQHQPRPVAPAQAEQPVAQTPAPETQQPVPATQPAVPFSEPVVEPLWMAAPAPTSSVSSPIQEPTSQLEVTLQQLSRQAETVAQPVPPVPATPSSASVRQPAQSAPKVPPVPKKPVVSNDLSLDDLELTMRRPVVKLQPTTQRPTNAPGQTQSSTVGKSRSGAANRAEESSLSYKERLRKGYHHQLAGDYDEAMQEYRVIIRNAPELLGEIVSNMRALLKLAPRYAPGYRVLGDAYMRQGEYLQAMEAYNKALMMTKKGAQGQAQGQR